MKLSTLKPGDKFQLLSRLPKSCGRDTIFLLIGPDQRYPNDFLARPIGGTNCGIDCLLGPNARCAVVS